MEVQDTLDRHCVTLIHCIKQTIEANKQRIPSKHPLYNQIRRGASLLWKHYFRYADKDDDTTDILEPLSVIVERLRNDLCNTHQGSTEKVAAIKAYGDLFGLPLLEKKN